MNLSPEETLNFIDDIRREQREFYAQQIIKAEEKGRKERAELETLLSESVFEEQINV